MSDMQMFVFMTITIILMNILFVYYDSDICPNVELFEEGDYGVMNQTGEYTYDDIRNMECTGIPVWLKASVNAPFLIALGLIFKKYILV